MYTALMQWTDANAGARIQEGIVDSLEGARRLRAAMEMSDLARDLALARLRQAHPEYSERDLILALLSPTLRSSELPPELR